MSEASLETTKSVKSRPSLLLSGPTRRVGSEDDHLDMHSDLLLSRNSDNDGNIVNNSSSSNKETKNSPSDGPGDTDREVERAGPFQLNKNDATQQDNRMNVSKEDLIRLLSMLKSELQSKEIALATIKLEQLKRLMNPVEISRSSLATTYFELQDRLKALDHTKNNDSKKQNENIASASNQVAGSRSQSNTNSNLGDDQNIDENEESLNMLSTLLELLDRHPLLALPRDSIYCLDYNCNELSTKNYLNLKIQNLDNLIEQHRRFRYFMSERLKRSEQRHLELSLKLELEKKIKSVEMKTLFESSGKASLLKVIEELKDSLEKEKTNKFALVMSLLNELLDERERNETLTKKIAELEIKCASNNKPQPPNKPRVPPKPVQLLDRRPSQNP